MTGKLKAELVGSLQTEDGNFCRSAVREIRIGFENRRLEDRSRIIGG